MVMCLGTTCTRSLFFCSLRVSAMSLIVSPTISSRAAKELPDKNIEFGRVYLCLHKGHSSQLLPGPICEGLQVFTSYTALIRNWSWKNWYFQMFFYVSFLSDVCLFVQLSWLPNWTAFTLLVSSFSSLDCWLLGLALLTMDDRGSCSGFVVETNTCHGWRKFELTSQTLVYHGLQNFSSRCWYLIQRQRP